LSRNPNSCRSARAYGGQRQDGPVLPRNKYVAIRQEKPANKQEATLPELKTRKFATEGIVSEGSEKGETQKVCANPASPVRAAYVAVCMEWNGANTFTDIPDPSRGSFTAM
jgi:ParB family chromosome partitioning protein